MFSAIEHWSQHEQLLAVFAAVILPLFAFDLWVMIRDADKIPKMRNSALWVATWIALALGFNALIFAKLGAAPAADFLTAYLVEWSLSVDNLVVFMVIFSYFHIPLRLQRRVLLWGIIAALAMRAVIIVTGSFLIAYFNWIFYIFGIILLISAYKMARGSEEAEDFDQKLIIRLCRLFALYQRTARPTFFHQTAWSAGVYPHGLSPGAGRICRFGVCGGFDCGGFCHHPGSLYRLYL
ncbi:MAG: hypothetical protein FJX22_04345 [Alphaproteobacteria bacterium]|nr:hypothetical protein [Alphaproteobacteria bacterium]